jgi:hypothetical protein
LANKYVIPKYCSSFLIRSLAACSEIAERAAAFGEEYLSRQYEEPVVNQKNQNA